MESQTNEVRLQMKIHELDLLDIEKIQEFVKSKYPSVTLTCKPFGISLNGKQQEVDSVYRKIEETIGGVKSSSMTVSKSALSVLQAESVYIHLLTLFKAKLLNCTYDASADCGTIVFVHGFVDQQIEQAKKLISIEIQECKIQMTKALKPLLSNGTILISKLETEETKGCLKYSIGENYLKLCGLLDSLAHIKMVIDKMTKDSVTLSNKSRRCFYATEKDNGAASDIVQDKPSELSIDLGDHEVVLLSNCDIISNLPNALPDLHVEFTLSSLILRGEQTSIQTAEIQIREIRRAIIKTYCYSLYSYAPLLESESMLHQIKTMLHDASINGTYVVSGNLVYLCAIDEFAYDQLKQFIKTTLKEVQYDYSSKLHPCLLPTGCIYKEMQKLKEAGLVEFGIYPLTRYVHVYGLASSVNQLILLMDKKSEDTDLRGVAVCNHKLVHSIIDNAISSTTNTNERPGFISNIETKKRDTVSTLGSEPLEPSPPILQVLTKDVPIQPQYCMVLLQHGLSDKLESICDDLVVDVKDNHVHLSGSGESVETASHFLEETIDSIKDCKVAVPPNLIHIFEEEKMCRDLRSYFRNKLGAAAAFEVTDSGLDVYAIGSVELMHVVQCISDVIHNTETSQPPGLLPVSLEGTKSHFSVSSDLELNNTRQIPGNISKESYRSETVIKLNDPSQSIEKHGSLESMGSREHIKTPIASVSNNNPLISECKDKTDQIRPKENTQSGTHHNNILDTEVSAVSSSSFSLSLSITRSTNSAASQTLPFQTYANDDVESLLTSKETHGSDSKDKYAESTLKSKFKFRNIASTSFKETNPTIVSSKHELVPSGSRHAITRTISTPSTRQFTEDILSTSSTSRFIMDTPLPSTSTKASTSIYSRSLSSNYEPMDIDLTSSYLYTPRREQKLTIIDSFRVAKTKLSLVVGCITLCQVDVIINETNPDLNLCQGAVSSAILEQEEGMQTECYAKSPQGIDIGEVCITQASTIKCQFVYHVTCCEQKDVGRSSEKAIKDTVLCCLTAINDTNLSSVAISPLGTTRSRVPREKSAVVMLEEIVNFLTNHKDTTISHIDIVLHEMDTRSHPVFEDEFANVALKFDPERRKTRSRYSWMRNYDWQL